MRIQLLRLLLLAIVTRKSTKAQIYKSALPDWFYGFGAIWMIGVSRSGDNYIPDTSVNNHVTGIEIYRCTDQAIYQLNILGDGVTRTIYPTAAGCSALAGAAAKVTLTIGTYERVTKIEAFHNSNTRWYRLKLTLNNGAIKEYNPAHGGTDTLHTFTVDAGQEFTGFQLEDDYSTNCQIGALLMIVRSPATCSAIIDLATIDGLSQNLISDVSQTKTFTAAPWECSAALEYQVTITPASATPNLISLSSPSSPNIVFAQSSNAADAQTYILTVKARQQGSSTWLSPPGQATATYTYNLASPCSTTTISPPSLTDMTTSVMVQITPGGSPLYTTQTASATDSVSEAQGNPIFCGNRQYSIASTPISGNTALSSSELTIGATTGLIQVYTANSATVGSHTVIVTTGLTSYTSVPQVTKTLTITILACIITSYSITALSPSYNLSYIIRDPTASWSITGSSVTTQVPACGYTQILTSTSNPGFFTTVPGATISFSAYTTSFSDDGPYTITVTSTLNNYIFSPPVPAPSCQSTFVFTAVASCNLSPTTLIAPTLLNMPTSVSVQSAGSPFYETQTVVFKDTISVAKGDDIITCASRSYAIASVPSAGATALTLSELTIGSSTGVIQVYTANSAAVGTHTVTVTATLASYATVSPATATFTIQISACIVTAFNMVALSDQTYTLADPTLVWSITGSLVTTQVPACGYTQTLTSTTPAFVGAVDGAAINFSAFSRNFIDAGSHTITVISTLDSQPTPFAQSSFILTVLSPCDTTTIHMVPSSIENLVAFAGYSTISQNKYVFNDTASFALTEITDTQDFCGEKVLSFTLNTTLTTLLQAVNAEFIVFSPPADSIYLGVGQAQITASMQNNPAIQSSPISFTATILKFEVPPSIPDQLYVLSSGALVINYEPFKVLPASFDAGTSLIQIYFFDGLNPPDRLDLTCSCMKLVDNQNFIDHEPKLREIRVFTKDHLLIGEHLILLVQTFANFADVNPFTQIKITVEPATNLGYYVKRSPYFKPALQAQDVVQCSNVETKPWSFVLPRRYDPNYREVYVETAFNKTFFKFDNELMKFTQREVAFEPVNQTINVTLSNELNLTAFYSMPVKFFCNQTQNYTRNFTFLNVVTKQPNLFIKKIEPSGLMHVKFSSKMKVPDQPEQIETGTTTLNETTYPNLKIQVVKGKYSDPHLLVLNNWTIVDFQPFEMLIQLNFTNKTYISSHDTAREQIKLTIYGYQLFQDIKGNLVMPETELKQKQLPLLDSPSNILEAQREARIVQIVIYCTLVSNTVLSMFVKGPLKTILDSVEQIRTIVHVLLINVAYPATATVFFGMLMQVLTFQIYDFSDFYNRVLSLDPDSEGNEPLNGHFDLMGYSSLYLVQNFGTLCWTVLVAPISWMASLFIDTLSKGKFTFYREKFRRMMFFDYWVVFLSENYIFLAVCFALNLYFLKWQGFGNTLNSLVSILTGLCVVAFPIFVAIFYNLQKNYDRILSRDDDYLSRFGGILSGLNFKRRGRAVILFTCSTMIIQLWLACIVVFNQDKQVFNIMMVNMQALCMMIVAGYSEAMIDRTANKMNQINQAFVLLFTYHLYQFTEFMTDLYNRDKVGRSLVVITIANVALNLGVISARTLVLTYANLKLLYKRSKQRTKIRQQRKRLMKLLAERDRNLKLQQEEKRMLKVLRQPEIHLQESFDFLNYLVSEQAKRDFYSENKIISDEFKSSDYQTNFQCSQQDPDVQRSISAKVKPFRPGQGLGRIVVPMYELQEHNEQKMSLPGAKTHTQKDFNQTLEVEEQKEIDDASNQIRVSDQNRFGNSSKTKNTSQLRTRASTNQVPNQTQSSAQAQPKTLTLTEIVQQLVRLGPPIRNFQYLKKNFPPNRFQVEKNNGTESKMSAQYSKELDQIQKPNQGRDASNFEVQAVQDLSVRNLALQEQVIGKNSSSLLGIEEQQLSGDAYIKYLDEAEYLNSEQLDRAQYQNERMNVLLSHPLKNQSSNSSFSAKQSSFKAANDSYGERSESQLSIHMRNQNHAREIIAPSIVNHSLMSKRPVYLTENKQASSQIQNLQHSTERKIPDRSKVTVMSIFQSQNKKVKESLAQLQKITGRRFSGPSNSPMKKKEK